MGKKLAVVMCRACGQRNIDRNNQNEGEDWVERSKGWFYHKKCYEEWIKGKDGLLEQKADSEWLDYTWDYLRKEVQLPNLEWGKFKSQWDNFLNTKTMTAKGIYFCLKFYYEIEHGSKEKALGGIGIVKSIYKRGTEYWIDRETKENGIVAKIEAQIREKAEWDKKAVFIKKETITKKKKSIGFSKLNEELEGEGNDN